MPCIYAGVLLAVQWAVEKGLDFDRKLYVIPPGI